VDIEAAAAIFRELANHDPTYEQQLTATLTRAEHLRATGVPND
jgi:hypothetical protein